MQALMQAGEGADKREGGLLDDLRPALSLLDEAEVDDSGPLATWTVPQVTNFTAVVSRLRRFFA